MNHNNVTNVIENTPGNSIGQGEHPPTFTHTIVVPNSATFIATSSSSGGNNALEFVQSQANSATFVNHMSSQVATPTSQTPAQLTSQTDQRPQTQYRIVQLPFEALQQLTGATSNPTYNLPSRGSNQQQQRPVVNNEQLQQLTIISQDANTATATTQAQQIRRTPGPAGPVQCVQGGQIQFITMGDALIQKTGNTSALNVQPKTQFHTSSQQLPIGPTMLNSSATANTSATATAIPSQPPQHFQLGQFHIQPVQTPTGQCYLLMNATDLINNGSNRPAQQTNQVQQAAFIPLSRLDGSSLLGSSSTSVTGASSSSTVNSAVAILDAAMTGDDEDEDDSTIELMAGTHNHQATLLDKYGVKRKTSHNQVEKRRRDKINQWINRLAKMLPEEDVDDTSRQIQSKGAILSRTVDFVAQLRETNQKLMQQCVEYQSTSNNDQYEIGELREEIRQLKEETQSLTNRLKVSESKVGGDSTRSGRTPIKRPKIQIRMPTTHS